MGTSPVGRSPHGLIESRVPVALAALLLLLCGFRIPLHAEDTQAAPDGRVVFVRALATAEAGGLQRALAQKDLVFVADTLRTSDKAMARFVMRDRTMLAMKPSSVVVLAEYEFKEGAGGDDKMVTQVVSGGLRALTGLVDKRQAQNVSIKTPLATIGVRGTAVQVEVLASDREEIVFDFGEGHVETGAGRVDVAQGWGARVRSADRPPELFKPEPRKDDPAVLAWLLLGNNGNRRGEPEPESSESPTAEELGAAADIADLVLTVGMLEQVPDAVESQILDVLGGLLRGSTDDSTLINAAVHAAPQRSARILETAVAAGRSAEAALGDVLGALLPLWPGEVAEVMAAAARLGVGADRAQEIMDAQQQSTPCRISNQASRPLPAGAAGETTTLLAASACTRPAGAASA